MRYLKPLYLMWAVAGLLAAYIVGFLYFNLIIYPKSLYYLDQPSKIDKTVYNGGDAIKLTIHRCSNGEYKFNADRKLVDTVEWNLVGLSDTTKKGCFLVERAIQLPDFLPPSTYKFDNTVTAHVKWFIYSRDKVVKTTTQAFQIK